MNVKVFKPEKDTMVEDLRRYADQIEKGECTPTSAVIVFSDRVSQKIWYSVAGERLIYSQSMGLLAYISHQMYKQAQGD